MALDLRAVRDDVDGVGGVVLVDRLDPGGAEDPGPAGDAVTHGGEVLGDGGPDVAGGADAQDVHHGVLCESGGRDGRDGFEAGDEVERAGELVQRHQPDHIGQDPVGPAVSS